ncbi:hypothetical protein AGMMS50293_07910 [Spirochaetia bacterium]|nr:hypothetical protein AGMMS50293_07910 [Spirochaetia bacterium]
MNILPRPLIFDLMEVYRPLRAGLFIYECARLLFLVGSFALLQPGGMGGVAGGMDGGAGGMGGGASFPWLAYTAPNALFPLMALFVWLDMSRYGVYLPLYLAGKCISLFSIAGWLISSRWIIMIVAWFSNVQVPAAPGLLVWVLLSGELLSTAAALLIMRKTRQAAAVPVPEGE